MGGDSNVPGAPADLHSLLGLDTLVVKKKIEMVEVVLGCETKNRYHIFDSQDKELFRAKEDTDWCTRQLCGQARPVELPIVDLDGKEVLHLTRPLKCQGCCFPCCLQEAQVTLAQSGMGLASVEQEWSWIHYKVWNFEDGEEVGTITRQWPGFCKQAMTDACHYTLNFPENLDIELKAALLGALFLVD